MCYKMIFTFNFTGVKRGFMRTLYKTTLRFISLLTLCLVALTSNALAQQKPDDVLKELLKKISEKQNASPVVEYVDWQEAFAKAPEDQKKTLNITNPGQMKEFYRQILESPTANFRKQVQERLAAVPEEQKPLMEQQLQRMEDLMRQKENEMKEKIAGTKYTVGDAKIEGNSAKVKLTQEYKGEKKEEDVQFIKVGDRWFLPSVAVMANDAKPKDGGVLTR